MVLEVPPHFGRDLLKGQKPETTAVIDGSSPFRAETIKQYAEGTYMTHMQDVYRTQYAGESASPSAGIQPRFRYNPTFESIYAIVPSVPPILMVLIPAILMAVSVAREKELGSIVNFYVSPATRLDFLVGKQLPYIAIGMVNFVLLTLLAVLVFGVGVKGSLATLVLCALLYVAATTSLGLVISGITGSQVAAVFVTTILTLVPTTQFSGMLQPVSTLMGGARAVGSVWPTTYYMHASVGAFTKALGPRLLLQDALVLAAFVPVLMAAAVALLRPQEA
jgi:ribosome-dependent ATPase